VVPSIRRHGGYVMGFLGKGIMSFLYSWITSAHAQCSTDCGSSLRVELFKEGLENFKATNKKGA